MVQHMRNGQRTDIVNTMLCHGHFSKRCRTEFKRNFLFFLTKESVSVCIFPLELSFQTPVDFFAIISTGFSALAILRQRKEGGKSILWRSAPSLILQTDYIFPFLFWQREKHDSEMYSWKGRLKCQDNYCLHKVKYLHLNGAGNSF